MNYFFFGKLMYHSFEDNSFFFYISLLCSYIPMDYSFIGKLIKFIYILLQYNLMQIFWVHCSVDN